jgi:hypothetical protein
VSAIEPSNSAKRSLPSIFRAAFTFDRRLAGGRTKRRVNHTHRIVTGVLQRPEIAVNDEFTAKSHRPR